MQLKSGRAFLCLALGACCSLVSGVEQKPKGVAGGLRPDVDVPSMCQKFAADHGRKLVMNLTSSKESNAMTCSAASKGRKATQSEKGVIKLKARKSSQDPKCSPVCAMQLDAVIVLSPSGGSITEASVARSKNHVEMLLEHFELGSSSGSLIGLVDISRGVDNPKVVTKLNGDRSTLNAAMAAWAPQLGGPTITEADLQGIESNPTMLAMLKDSRPEIKRTLVVLDVSPPKPDEDTSNAAEVPILVSVNGGKLARMPMPRKDHIDNLDLEVVDTLVAVCPAIVIDPSMACGRLRWGKGEPADPQAL